MGATAGGEPIEGSGGRWGSRSRVMEAGPRCQQRALRDCLVGSTANLPRGMCSTRAAGVFIREDGVLREGTTTCVCELHKDTDVNSEFAWPSQTMTMITMILPPCPENGQQKCDLTALLISKYMGSLEEEVVFYSSVYPVLSLGVIKHA